jgi:Trypsin-co-occurring domain 1
MDVIQDVVGRVNSSVKDIKGKPNHVEVEFGVKFDTEVGVIVAKPSMEASVNVKLTWDHQ